MTDSADIVSEDLHDGHHTNSPVGTNETSNSLCDDTSGEALILEFGDEILNDDDPEVRQRVIDGIVSSTSAVTNGYEFWRLRAALCRSFGG